MPKSPCDVLATRFRVVIEERERERKGGRWVSLRDSVETAETSSACSECKRGSRQSHWSSTEHRPRVLPLRASRGKLRR